MKTEAKYPYKKGRLHITRNPNGSINLAGRWYIEFYAHNENSKKKNKLERRRAYVKSYPTITARKAAAKELIEELNNSLESGYIIRKAVAEHNEETEKKFKVALDTFSLKDAFSYFKAKKKNTVRPNTYSEFKALENGLIEWLQNNGIENILFKDFKSHHADAFFDYLSNEKKVLRKGEICYGLSNKTFNNYLSIFKSFYKLFKKRNIIKGKESPVKNRENLEVESGKHVPYTDQQLQQIYNLARAKGDFQFLVFIQFIYFTFGRPTEEVRKLQVKDIKLTTIQFPPTKAKNKRGEHVIIPPELEKIIQENNFRNLSPEYYLFGPNHQPGPTHVGVNYFYRRNRAILLELKYTDQDYDLYGYKHTGNIKLYLAGADLISIQKQNRHTSVAQTEVYLKNLGLIRNDDVMSKFPSFTMPLK